MNCFVIRLGNFAIVRKGISNIQGSEGKWVQWKRLAFYIKNKTKKV
jgi:hypothetical protein